MATPNDSLVEKLETNLQAYQKQVLKKDMERELEQIEREKADLRKDRKSKNAMIFYAGAALSAIVLSRMKS